MRPGPVLTTGQRQAKRAGDGLSRTTQGAAYPLRQDESRQEPLLAGTKAGEEADQVGVPHLAVLIEILNTASRTGPPSGEHPENVRKPDSAILIEVLSTLALVKDAILVAILVVELTDVEDAVGVAVTIVDLGLVWDAVVVAVIKPAQPDGVSPPRRDITQIHVGRHLRLTV